MEDKTVQLLSEIAKNAEMGKSSVEELMHIAKDPSMQHHLKKQLSTYDDLLRRANAMLCVEGSMPKTESPLVKGWANIGIRAKTMMDDSNRNLAEMLIEGSHMGATELEKALQDAHGANQGAVALAQRLQSAEEQYAQELTSFL